MSGTEECWAYLPYECYTSTLMHLTLAVFVLVHVSDLCQDWSFQLRFVCNRSQSKQDLIKCCTAIQSFLGLQFFCSLCSSLFCPGGWTVTAQLSLVLRDVYPKCGITLTGALTICWVLQDHPFPAGKWHFYGGLLLWLPRKGWGGGTREQLGNQMDPSINTLLYGHSVPFSHPHASWWSLREELLHYFRTIPFSFWYWGETGPNSA